MDKKKSTSKDPSYMKKWRAENKERVRLYQEKYRATHLEENKLYMRRYRESKKPKPVDKGNVVQQALDLAFQTFNPAEELTAELFLTSRRI